MTILTRYSFQPRDIKAIQLECSNCKSVLTVLLNKGEGKGKDAKDAVYRCPVCQTPWLEKKQLKLEAIEGLLNGIQEFSRKEENGFGLSFEVAGLGSENSEKKQ
jgi:hypothetical protein